ncbi:response regulator transcription factor [Paenibacillus protaetiae]|uniref:Response regulator transcription factor n=1 Tax=Paenibacillus protaetiae TaxID=2509456 RepID=A0A4V0YEU1_9BACL|nr:response regulator transcription factor [Paenibacillus protaetiae]QAY65391.1 response regulator transcription factor [Paenibacillus protaetiae]
MWKIAIIDDDRQVLQGMKNAIPWEELHAEWAGEALNGQDGLEMIRAEKPDIVITDIYMPVMNGLDMIEQLRSDCFEGRIIILSGYSDFEYARQALRLNVSDYLSKPISLPTLKEVLGQTINGLMEDEERKLRQDEWEERIKRLAPIMEKEWIKGAISGTLGELYKQDEDVAVPYRYWTSTQHAVIGIDIVRNERVGSVSLSDLNLFRFAVRNIACEVAAGFFAHFEYTELHGTHSALLVHPDQHTDVKAAEVQLLQLGKQIKDAVESYLKLKLKIGIGGIKSCWKEIPDSTEEAFRAIDWKSHPLEPGADIYGIGNTAEKKQTQLIRPVKFYQELGAAIKAGQETLACQLADDFAGQLSGPDEPDSEYLQLLAREISAIMAYSMYEVGTVLDEICPSEVHDQEWASIATVQQLTSWLKDKITSICSSRQWKGNGKHRQAVDFMIQYIHDHYPKDITLADLADKVFISRNYLSHIFKSITGDSFNTYLTRVRMEKAKELLMERKMLVYEVAEKVGYQNVPYFSTLFKKYSGMNPTDLVKS